MKNRGKLIIALLEIPINNKIRRPFYILKEHLPEHFLLAPHECIPHFF